MQPIRLPAGSAVGVADATDSIQQFASLSELDKRSCCGEAFLPEEPRPSAAEREPSVQRYQPAPSERSSNETIAASPDSRR